MSEQAKAWAICTYSSDYEWMEQIPIAVFPTKRDAKDEADRLTPLIHEACVAYDKKERAINEREYGGDDWYDREERAKRRAMLNAFRGLPYGLDKGLTYPDRFREIIVNPVFLMMEMR